MMGDEEIYPQYPLLHYSSIPIFRHEESTGEEKKNREEESK
jgi:hypothetical protein